MQGLCQSVAKFIWDINLFYLCLIFVVLMFNVFLLACSLFCLHCLVEVNLNGHDNLSRCYLNSMIIKYLW